MVVGVNPVANTPGYEVLAVYRRTETGMLWRLKRWPKAIEDMPPGPGAALGPARPGEASMVGVTA